MRKLVVILIILVVGGGAYYLLRGKPPAQAQSPEVSTVIVKRGPIFWTVSTTGRVVSNLDVEIKCKASGEIINLPFDVSDTPQRGDLLVELNPIDEERNKKQAEVALSASQARLIQAQQNLTVAQSNLATEEKRAEANLKASQARYEDSAAKTERVKQLFEKKLASREEYETAQTSTAQAAAELETTRVRLEELKTQELALELKRQDVALAQAQVESDKIALSNAEQRLKDTKVYAPIDGTVAARNVQVGQIISSGISNVGGGTTVMVVSDLSRIFILASVDESDIGNVKIGQKARITVDAFPMAKLHGKIVRIATKGVNTSGVVTFEVKIEVLGESKSLLKPEMTANVEIIIEGKEDVLSVPVQAVTRKDGKQFVSVSRDGKRSEECMVEVGLTDGVSIEITNGLKEGETVTVRKGEVDSRWSNQQRRGIMMFGTPTRHGGTRGR